MELFTEEEYNKAKFRDLLPVKCDVCGLEYTATKRNRYKKRTCGFSKDCCRKKCSDKAHVSMDIVPCANCGKEKKITASDRKNITKVL